MTRIELDRLLERTVAEALGVELPARQRRQRPSRRQLRALHNSPRPREIARELHPA